MRIFKKYCSLCPKDANSFYLQPLQHPTSTCWYSTHPLGHNTLSSTVAKLCKLAGIGGFKTNHLLMATATSRLYRSGINEQLVMEMTRHRSLERVHYYKCTSDDQRKTLSDILNRTETAPTIALLLKSNGDSPAIASAVSSASSVSVWENKQPSSPHSLTSLVVSTCLEQTSLSELLPWLVECKVAMWKETTYGHVFRLRLTILLVRLR